MRPRECWDLVVYAVQWDEDERRVLRRLLLALAAAGVISAVQHPPCFSPQPATRPAVVPLADPQPVRPLRLASTSEDVPRVSAIERDAAELLRWGAAQGIVARVTSIHRTTEQQAALYERWRAGLSRYPVARPGHSLHEVGRAFDLAIDADNDLSAAEALRHLGARWEVLGGVWGGRFDDPIHFERRASED